MKRLMSAWGMFLLAAPLAALDHPGMVSATGDGLRIIAEGRPTVSIAVDPAADMAVKIAAANLAKDFERVCGEAGVLALPDAGVTVNFNARLNEAKENIYSVFYPMVARRVVANEVKVKVPGVTSRRDADKNGLDMPRREATPGTLDTVPEPLDPGITFERVIVDWSGSPIRGYLNGDNPKYAPPAKPKTDCGALDRSEPYITSSSPATR